MIRATRPSDGRWRDLGVWEGRTIGSHLDSQVLRRPAAVAVVDGDVVLSYAELGERVAALAGSLHDRGVGVGDAILVQLPNWWEAVVAFHAVARLGAVANPVIPIYRRKELRFILRQVRPKAVIVPHRFRGVDYLDLYRPLLDELPEREHPVVRVARPEGDFPGGTLFDAWLDGPPRTQDDADAGTVGLVLYTSGTTADPKGVLHSHDTLLAECRSIIDTFGLGDDDHVFMGSPLTHITGFLYGFALPAMTGATSVLLGVWDPTAAAGLIQAWATTFTVAATPFLRTLTEEYERAGEKSVLRHFVCGGADVPPDLVREATSVLDCDVVRAYGLSELPTWSCGRPADPIERKAGTDGYPVGRADGRLIDTRDGVGELVADGPELFLGYLDPALNDAAFTPDGYFRTGDLATFTDDGFVTIAGRSKDIIIRNGENISAREVEDLLYRHPAVADVAVVAVPHPRTGECGCAFVVPAAGQAVELDDLVSFLRGHDLAVQKLPERLEIIDELPRTASGKIQKFVLRARLETLRPEEVPTGG